MQADISEIDEFLDWLEEYKNTSREDMRLHLMYGWFAPRALQAVGYFRRDRDRHLRREVVDKFLKGGSVDMTELREGVLGLCLAISGMGDAVYSAKKQQEREMFRPPRNYGRRPTRRM